MGGDIIVESAYAQGKMLNNKKWETIVRGSPSDIDLVANMLAYDNNGQLLLMEYSTKTDIWEGIGQGQRMLYDSLIRPVPKIAALCYHRTPVNERIDTIDNVLSFQYMLYRNGKVHTAKVRDGKDWPAFINACYEGKIK